MSGGILHGRERTERVYTVSTVLLIDRTVSTVLFIDHAVSIELEYRTYSTVLGLHGER
jgi:hypothetical protein